MTKYIEDAHGNQIIYQPQMKPVAAQAHETKPLGGHTCINERKQSYRATRRGAEIYGLLVLVNQFQFQDSLHFPVQIHLNLIASQYFHFGRNGNESTGKKFLRRE